MWNDVWMQSQLGDELAAAVAVVTPRRVELLLAALRHGGSFTATELRDALGEDGGSLPRDLRALELGGWLLADPPATSGRQGRLVTYTVTPLAVDLFPRLADLVSDALTARPPAPEA